MHNMSYSILPHKIPIPQKISIPTNHVGKAIFNILNPQAQNIQTIKEEKEDEEV